MKKLSYILLGLFVILWSSCKEDDNPYVGYINVDRAVLEPQAGSLTLTADTDISGAITTVVDQDASAWCQVSVNGKDIIVTATQNQTEEQRFATVSVRAGYRVTSFKVIQKKEGLNLLEYSSAGWSATASSTQLGDGGGTDKLFTENRTTEFWHSQYNPLASLPHWVLVDMKQELEVSMIRVAWRLYNGGNYASARVVEVLISTDGETFTSVGEILKEAPEGGRSPNYPAFDDWSFNTTKTRYIKVLIKETNTANGATQIGYVKAFELV